MTDDEQTVERVIVPPDPDAPETAEPVPVPYIPRPGQADPTTQPIVDDPHASLGAVLHDIAMIQQNAGAMVVSGTFGDIYNSVKKQEQAIGELLQWACGIKPIIEAAHAAVPPKEEPKVADEKDARITELEEKIENQRKIMAANGL